MAWRRVGIPVVLWAAAGGCWRGGFDTWQAERPAEAGPGPEAAVPDRALAVDRAVVDAASADATTDAAPADAATVDAGLGSADAAAPPFLPTLVGGLELGGQVHAIAVAGPLAVLATAVPAAQLQVLDLTVATAPLVLGSAAASDSALHGVALAGTLAFAVGAGAPPQLEIFDLGDPGQPRRLSGAPLADTGYDIAVAAGRAYVVGESGGDDLEIFDVTDPVAPSRLGGLNVLDSYYVRGVDVVGTVAFIGGTFLKAIDVSDPAAPRELDSTTWSEAFYWYSYDVQAVGALVYAIESNNGGREQLSIFDASDPTALRRLGLARATNSYVRDLHVSGRHAFVAADDSNDFVDVFDVADPAAPRRVWTTVLPAGGLSVHADAQVMYVGLQPSSGFELEAYALLPP